MEKILLILFLTTSLFAEAEKICTPKSCFPKEIIIGDIKLEIVQPYDFKYIIFDAYSIALYLPQGANPKDWSNFETPKALKLIYHRDFSKDDFAETGSDYILKNPEVDNNKIRDSLSKINKAYLDIKVNDSYTITYDPLNGLGLDLNSQNILNNLKDPYFASHYFGIWLSKYGIDQAMRESLLKLSNL